MPRPRSISAENPSGGKGQGGRATEGTGAVAARELGPGWKVSPCIHLSGNSVVELANIEGPGAIQQLWMTVKPEAWRQLILRCYWDHEDSPSVEVPLGDFFCSGWGERCNVNSLPISVNPAGGFNSYWEMPFRHHARITIENLSPDEVRNFFYQINYTLTEVPADRAYFHAQWRRNNPLVLSGGPYAAGWRDGPRTLRWHLHCLGGQQYRLVGRGRDQVLPRWRPEWPTICGTGTEDYFGGAWGFHFPAGEYGVFTTPFLGMPQVISPEGVSRTQQRFGLYRWHVLDPIRFKRDLRVTIQALGWRQPLAGQRRYLPLQDDIASTAIWYQTEPHAPFPQLPDLNSLEVI